MFFVRCIDMIRRRFLSCPAPAPSPLHTLFYPLLVVHNLLAWVSSKQENSALQSIEIQRWHFNKNVQPEMMRQLKHDVILITLLHIAATYVGSPPPLVSYPLLFASQQLFHAFLINFGFHSWRVGGNPCIYPINSSKSYFSKSVKTSRIFQRIFQRAADYAANNVRQLFTRQLQS